MRLMIRWSFILWLLAVCSVVSADSVDFELSDLQGKVHRLSDYRGQWVLVNYWATWCPPCREEIPELEMFYNRHSGGKAVVLGVNMENIGSGKLVEFVEEQFISYPILRGRPDASTVLGAVPGLPTSYLVSPAGEVVGVQVGPITAEMIEDFIETYVPEQAIASEPDGS